MLFCAANDDASGDRRRDGDDTAAWASCLTRAGIDLDILKAIFGGLVLRGGSATASQGCEGGKGTVLYSLVGGIGVKPKKA